MREIMRNCPTNESYILEIPRVCRTVPNRKIPSSVIPARSYTFWNPAGQAIVIACNTASALALDTIEKEIDLPIIGVVKPGAQMAVETTQNKRVGVIATESTIQSGLYQQLITEADPAITVTETVSAVRAARGRGLDKRSDHRGSGAPLSGRDSG